VAESKKPKPDNPEQSKRFEETAKGLGLKDGGKTFERAMRSLIPAKEKKRR
jgi:hypothetical protein